METLSQLLSILLSTIKDVIPIIAIIFGFQLLVIRRPIPHLKRVLIGFVYVILGLALFLLGLDKALFPIGELMAQQLTNPEFIRGSVATSADKRITTLCMRCCE